MACQSRRRADFAAHLRPRDFSPGNGNEAPRALGDVADIERRTDPDVRREHKFERRRRWCFRSRQGHPQKAIAGPRRYSGYSSYCLRRQGTNAGRVCDVSECDRQRRLFPTTIAGSLPKPSWLAEPNRLWAAWRLSGDELAAAKDDATLLALKLQEDAGIDIVADGEQARQHFVHGFLEAVEGIDFEHRVEMGIRNNRYLAMCPTVTGPLGCAIGCTRGKPASPARTPKHPLKFTLPGPMTIVDTVADAHYGDRVKMAMAFATCSMTKSRGLAADGVDVIQFDEPAFNVYMEEAAAGASKRCTAPSTASQSTSAVHICYGYGIPANIHGRHRSGTSGGNTKNFSRRWRQGRIDQVSVECINSRVPLSLLGLLDGKDVLVGAIDVASDDRVETPEEVAAVIGDAPPITCRREKSSPAPTAEWRRCTAMSR